MAGDNVVSKIKGAVSSVVDVVWALLALGIVLQILFGSNVLFLPVDVIGNITDLVNPLGGAGLSGLVTIGVI